ncbi:hypothetical protein AB0M72_03580 [Nocardiopsis dassonvillei]
MNRKSTKDTAKTVETKEVPTPAAEETQPETVTIEVPGHGPVEVPADTITKAAKSLNPARGGSRRPALPSEAWKLDPKYRRYSEAVTYVVDLKDAEAQSGTGLVPETLAPGLVLEWAAVCETHEQTQMHRSKGAAVYAAADSMLWCGGCETNVRAAADKATEVAVKATDKKAE